MLLIATRVADAGARGLGLFCTEAVAAGTPIYRNDPRFLRFFTNQEVAELPDPCRVLLLKYAYRGTGAKRRDDGVYFCTDDARFMNHAPQPSTVYHPASDSWLAARDLPAGSELTCNYLDFCEATDLDFDPAC